MDTFRNAGGRNVFEKIANGLRELVPGAENAALKFRSLTRANFTLGTGLNVLLGGIFSVLGGLVSLAGAAGGAAASLGVVANGAFALVAGMIAARVALGGVGRALGALNRQSSGAADNTRQVQQAEQALAQTIERNRETLINANNEVRRSQLALNEAIKQGQEEIQQLGFDAEEAALSESRAALELDKAREILARTQDLPPNSRARKEAELAFQEAELNLRRAKDRSSDLNEEQDRLAKTGVSGTQVVIDATNDLAEAEANKARAVRDGIRDQIAALDALTAAQERAAGGGGANPLEGLNEAQITFVRFLQSIQPRLKEVKAAISAAFLPPLQEAITVLVNQALPTIETGMVGVAAATGNAAKYFANAVADGQNLVNLGKLFESSGRIIETFGKASGSLYGALLSVMTNLIPAAEQFADFLDSTFGKFDAYMKDVKNQPAITDFFERSKNALADFGEIFGNIFGGFGKIINANLGPGTGGQLLLDWLKESTQKFQDMDSTFDGAGGMRAFFRDVASNTKSIMQSIGALLGELIKLGANPAIGETFDILKIGAPFIGVMMKEAVEAGPAMAELIVVLSEIGSLLADSDVAVAFFQPMIFLAEKVRDVLKNETVQAILDVVGPILGFIAGVGVITQVAGFLASVIIGKLVVAFQALGTVFGLIAANPVIAILIGLAALMVYLYNTNEEFAASLNKVFGEISAAFSGVMAEIGPQIAGAFSQLGPILADLALALGNVVLTILPLLIPLIQIIVPVVGSLIEVFAGLVTILAGVLLDTINALLPTFEILVKAIGDIVIAIMPLVKDLLESLVPAFLGIVEAILPLIPLLLEALLPVFNDLVTAIVPVVITLAQLLIPVIQKLIEYIGPLIVILINQLAPIFMMLIQQIMPFVGLLINTLIPAFLRIVDAIMPVVFTIIDLMLPVILQLMDALLPLITMLINALVPAFMSIVQAIVPLIELILPPLVALFELLMPVIQLVADLILGPLSFALGMISGLFKLLTGDFEGAGKVFGDVFQGMLDFGKKIVNDLIGIFEGMINFVIDGFNRMIDFINSLKIEVPDWVPLIGGQTLSLNIPRIGRVSIPRLAEGGVVPARPGGTLAQIGEAGRPERVEPLDANGMSKRDQFIVDLIKSQQGEQKGINITVNPSPGMDEQALAQAVSRQLAFEMRRGSVY
jgi:phage-related protein